MSLPITPKGGTENYPHDWDGLDVPDWISATCAVCGEDIEWDPRNLWVHSDGEPSFDNPWDSPYAGGPYSAEVVWTGPDKRDPTPTAEEIAQGAFEADGWLNFPEM